MTSQPHITKLFDSLHNMVMSKLDITRAAILHPSSKGTASETSWINMLNEYLPTRYTAASAFVVDSENALSEQIDLVIYDRQYTPVVFQHEGATYIPAEGVYAVFEVKQEASKENIDYAKKKIASVRALHRTSMPVPHVEGLAKSKTLHRVIGGFLATDSSWSPPIGDPLIGALSSEEKIDICCLAKHGVVEACDEGFSKKETDKAVTLFLLRLISNLQAIGTVPMIDVMAYARWL